VLYHLNVHIPLTSEEEAADLGRLRSALEAEDSFDLREVHVHEGEDGHRAVHVESRLEAPSAYHAAHVSGADVYKRVLKELGMEDRSITISAERAGDPAA
jgi:hypothetical protein